MEGRALYRCRHRDHRSVDRGEKDRRPGRKGALAEEIKERPHAPRGSPVEEGGRGGAI
jgi:hypothetical protein